MDGGEIRVHLGDDFKESVVFGAGFEFGTHRKKKGDLIFDLIFVHAIENSIEAGVGEVAFEFFGHCGLFFEDRIFWGGGLFAVF